MPIDLSQYLALFVSEGSAHAESLGRDLLALETEAPPPGCIDSVFRHIHSIKGMAASMEFAEIVELAHAAEDLVGLLRQRQGGPVNRPTIDLLLGTAERLSAMIRERGEKRQLGPADGLVAGLLGLISAPIAGPARTTPVEPAPEPRPAASLHERLRSVRVKAELLDDLLEVAGELLLENARLRELARGLGEPLRGAFDEGLDRMHAMVRSFHQRIVAVRLTPLSLLTDQLPRHLREVTRQLGREVDLAIEGAEVEVDRTIVDELADAVLHLIRNCADHGIEPPDRREAAGKPRRGSIRVEARRERDRLILEIADDGRGFDTVRLRAAAVARGILDGPAAAALDEAAALQLACWPGISTASSVTEISGRGVGLDAVKNSIEGLGGTLEITSTLGQGSRFRLRLPLAVALVQVLLAEVDHEIVALPVAKVLGAVELHDESWLSGSPHVAPRLEVQGAEVPLHHLGRLLGWGGLGSAEGEWVGTQPVLLVESRGRPVGLKVDRLVGQQEAVLKPLAASLSQLPGLSAMTLLGTGRPVFVLDVPRLLEGPPS